MLVIERTFAYGSSQLSKYTKYQIERPASLKYAYHIQVTLIIEVDFSQGGVFVSGREQIFAGTLPKSSDSFSAGLFLGFA